MNYKQTSINSNSDYSFLRLSLDSPVDVDGIKAGFVMEISDKKAKYFLTEESVKNVTRKLLNKIYHHNRREFFKSLVWMAEVILEEYKKSFQR
jgi:hypothetical protein